MLIINDFVAISRYPDARCRESGADPQASASRRLLSGSSARDQGGDRPRHGMACPSSRLTANATFRHVPKADIPRSLPFDPGDACVPRLYGKKLGAVPAWNLVSGMNQ